MPVIAIYLLLIGTELQHTMLTLSYHSSPLHHKFYRHEHKNRKKLSGELTSTWSLTGSAELVDTGDRPFCRTPA